MKILKDDEIIISSYSKVKIFRGGKSKVFVKPPYNPAYIEKIKSKEEICLLVDIHRR